MYPKQCRLRRAAVVAGVFALTIGSAASAGGGYSLSGSTVAAAGERVATNCFTLTSTVGEPVAGATSSGSISVTAGFQATLAAHEQIIIADRIFQNGFDSGTCTP